MAGTSSGASVAVGATTGLNFGVASVGTVSQSLLASNYTPGEKPLYRIVEGIIMLICGVVIGYIGVYFLKDAEYRYIGISCIAFSILSVIVGISFCNKVAHNKRVSEWEIKTKLLDYGWICHKCGDTWVV